MVDGEGTDVARSQLVTGESEMDGEPDLLSPMVSGSGRSSCVGLTLMCPNCPL